MEDKEWLRPKEVAKNLGFSVITIYKWIKEGKIKAKKINKRVILISKQSLEEFLKTNKEDI